MVPLLLPAGFTLPPPGYLLFVVVAGVAVTGGLYRRSPPITPALVVALTPWMAIGASLYALSQIEWLPAIVAPLTTAPTVYLTVYIGVGTLLLGLGGRSSDSLSVRSTPGIVGAIGLLGVLCVGVIGTQAALAHPPVTIQWPALAVLGAIVATAVLWGGLRAIAPDITRTTGGPGALVVTGHSLDGLSTAVGLTQLGFGEQTPLSRLLIDLGSVWLFVGVKMLLAVFVLWVLAEYVRERPSEGNLLLGVIAAVGLGPGIHNVVLFTIA